MQFHGERKLTEKIVGKIKTFLFDGQHVLGLNLISNEPVEFEFKINKKNQLILEGPLLKSSKTDNSRVEGAYESN